MSRVMPVLQIQFSCRHTMIVDVFFYQSGHLPADDGETSPYPCHQRLEAGLMSENNTFDLACSRAYSSTVQSTSIISAGATCICYMYGGTL